MATAQLAAVPEPKYWHLRTVLLRAIDTEFSTGQVLPNERDLSARFGVARATLRQALDQLELEGRLVRRRGIGTLVAAPRVGVAVNRGEEGWPASSRDQSWRAVDCTTTEASEQLARALGVAVGETVHTVRRVRVVQAQIVATESLHVPEATLKKLPAIRLSGAQPAGSGSTGSGSGSETVELAKSVLRRLERLGVDGESRSVELGVAEAQEAALLERPPGTPVLVVTTQYAAGGRLAALATSTYRADTCRLTFGETGLVEVTPVPAVPAARSAS
ncbi:DNA-binding GntR family transcriptional regulator [Kitasatospora sp. MAP12-15]|uniref:GntR family transcriptional regulator n=1 Tax=unclassified Kitasatospora TaxID=2633591 RepID=UPI002474B1C6|nr:GntR family transcriptional regulator [Kitasatospora sp. MAP12-44]MDH6114690.1 DNA-binding GntR family transcriptional regulator [Kitasatospora sp. MAP12-44]